MPLTIIMTGQNKHNDRKTWLVVGASVWWCNPDNNIACECTVKEIQTDPADNILFDDTIIVIGNEHGEYKVSAGELMPATSH